MKNKILVWLLVIVLLLSVIVLFYKPSVHDASIEELQEIYGIGEVLSERIASYLDCNPDAVIDDLIYIDGIGYIKLNLIKRKYGD